MSVYEAIMKAAEHIESHPKDFCFLIGSVPNSCGSPGCALGWISHFLGSRKGDFWQAAIKMGLGEDHKGFTAREFIFYKRMDSLAEGWRTNAPMCANALRDYAAKYHKPAGRSDSELVKHWVAVVRQKYLDEHVKSEELSW